MSMFTKNSPYEVKIEAGDTAYFCQCGHTKKPPYCDGSHLNHPPAQPFEFDATEDASVWVCGCGRSGNKPWCDGTHKK